MASLHKRNGTPFFHAAYRDADGSRRLRSTGTSDKRTAQRIADEYEQAAKQGRDQRLTMKRVRDVLQDIYKIVHDEELPSDETGPFLTQWLERKESELQDSSASAYQQTVKLFLAHIGPKKNKPLDTITRAIITDFRDGLLKRVSPSTSRKQVVILRAAFNDAVREGRMRENPAEGVKVSKKSQGQQRQPFKPEELQQLLAAANQEWRAMILTGYCTGARLGDIATLNWNDNIDLEAEEIRFNATKTGKGMILPLPDQLQTYLVKLPSYDTGGAVFPEANEVQRRAGTSSLSNQFKAIMHKAKLAEEPTHKKTGEGRDSKRTVNALTFHSLRHNFVSNLKMSGSGDSVARELAGHSSAAVSRVYTHGNADVLRAAINKIPVLTIPEAKNEK
jgi:integrase